MFPKLEFSEILLDEICFWIAFGCSWTLQCVCNLKRLFWGSLWKFVTLWNVFFLVGKPENFSRNLKEIILKLKFRIIAGLVEISNREKLVFQVPKRWCINFHGMKLIDDHKKTVLNFDDSLTNLYYLDAYEKMDL